MREGERGDQYRKDWQEGDARRREMGAAFMSARQ